MKKEMYLYLVWVLIIANQLYCEIVGLNALIIVGATIAVFSILRPENLARWKWWLSAFLMTLSALSVFIDGSGYAIFLYIVSAIFFMCIQIVEIQSLPFSVLQTTQSWATGFYHFFHHIFTSFEGKVDTDRKKLGANILLVVLMIIVFIVFLKLYQNADDTFKAYTKWINLDWISWSFLVFYGLLSLMLYGLFFFKKDTSIEDWEKSLKNDIAISYSDKLQQFFTIKIENRVGVALLILLNVMLLLYNAIDVKFVATDLFTHSFESNFSQIVHGGINSLITSIVLVILIITFLFRGQLNFFDSKLLKRLGFLWLVQNIVMIFTSAIKNGEYIANWGLTYKRIGVFIYLALALIGLVLTIYKLQKSKSIWFLIRSTSLSFFAFFILFTLPNWDRQIAKFNLNEIKNERADYSYLLDLSSSSSAELIEYDKENDLPEDVIEKLRNRAAHFYHILSRTDENTSWRSMNIAERYDLEIINSWEKLDKTLRYNRYEN